MTTFIDNVTPITAEWLNKVDQTVTGLAASSGASLISYNGRRLDDKLGEFISAKDAPFNAKGDGVSDDTAAIQAADLAAGLAKKTLFFPAGTYRADPLTATTSWAGERGTVIKYRGTSNVDLVTATGINHITFTDIEFDGNVSADPVAWSSSNYDAFTGATGLSINSCDGAKVVRCRGRNMRQHSFRFYACTNALWDACNSYRNRGNFGDGFIAISCIGVLVRGCRSYDFTRIGFVFDTYGSDPKTSYHITVESCSAEYGHDYSRLYGGTESNVGLWAEQCAHMTINGFSAKNMGGGFGRGVNLCSGTKNNGVVGASATFIINDVRCENTGGAVRAYSLGTFPVSVILNNVQAYQVYEGISFVANLDGDNFKCSNGYIDLDFTINPNVTVAYYYEVKPGLSTKPRIEYNDCTVKHTNEDVTRLSQYYTTYSCADVGSYSANTNTNGASLRISNMRNVDASPIWIGVPSNNACDLRVSDTYVRIAYAQYLGNGSAIFDNCRIRAAQVGNGNLGSATKVEFRNCSLEGAVTAGGDVVRIIGGTIAPVGSEYVWIQTKTTGKRPAITILGVAVEKDFAVGGYALRFGFGASSYTVLMDNVYFYNSAGTATNNPCLVYASGSQLQFGGCRKDSTATYLCDLDTGGGAVALATGVVATAFH